MAKSKSWFRFYDRMIDSPQILALSDSEFRLIVSLWCVSSAEGQGGAIPYEDVIIRRRLMPDTPLEELQEMLEHLKGLDLLSGSDGNYSIPRWETHQYEYESRIPKNRRTKKQVSGSDGKEMGKSLCSNGQENVQIDTDTDTDTDTDKELMADITPSERNLLHKANEIYPNVYDYERDLQFMRDLTVKFPAIDLHEELCKWQLWLTEHKHPKNWRLAFHNWCKKAKPTEGGGKYQTPRNTTKRSAYADFLQF